MDANDGFRKSRLLENATSPSLLLCFSASLGRQRTDDRRRPETTRDTHPTPFIVPDQDPRSRSQTQLARDKGLLISLAWRRASQGQVRQDRRLRRLRVQPAQPACPCPGRGGLKKKNPRVQLVVDARYLIAAPNGTAAHSLEPLPAVFVHSFVRPIRCAVECPARSTSSP